MVSMNLYCTFLRAWEKKKGSALKIMNFGFLQMACNPGKTLTC